MIGKISVFGGPDDSGMTRTEGLSLYEHKEADKRPDLFLPRNMDDLDQGTSKRLRPDALYFAMRYPHSLPRALLQHVTWTFRNPSNGMSCTCALVDWGPHIKTGRVFDLSPRAAELIGAETDDVVEGNGLL